MGVFTVSYALFEIPTWLRIDTTEQLIPDAGLDGLPIFAEPAMS
jgi:hypothetical protein